MKRKSQKHIEIDGEKVSLETVQILMGEKGEVELKKEWLPVALVIDTPEELPFHLSEIKELETDEDLRLALIRVQVNSQLRKQEDLNYYQKQLFAAQIMEILLYQRLKLKPLAKKKKRS